MTIAYWCVLAAILLPYVFSVLAKAGGPEFDNRTPREYLSVQHGWRKRAHWSQLNAFEAFPPFAAAVIIAHQLGAHQSSIDILAVTFVLFRVLHGALYIADLATLRSIAWTGGFACVLGLFVVAA